MWTEMGRVPECGGEFKRSEAKKEIKDHKQKKKKKTQKQNGVLGKLSSGVQKLGRGAFARHARGSRRTALAGAGATRAGFITSPVNTSKKQHKRY